VEQVQSAAELPDLEAIVTACLEAASRDPDASAPVPAGPLAAGVRANDSGVAAASDPGTGLRRDFPWMSAAKGAIQRALGGETQVYAATFYVNRMHRINARLGDAIGDQVILHCSQHIATQLMGAHDALFRWRGPGFVALLVRPGSPLVVASEVQRFTSIPLSRFFETPSHTVYLPIKLTGEVFPLAGKGLDEVLEQVQQSLHALGETGD
jgi:GGDEF domain-containing protein